MQGGHVYVDFGQMPTDKFEQMLKSIRVPIWLSGNKTWYVRTDGSDANDGSANDAAHAFKTIQAAINFVTSNYNLGVYSATIMIAAGLYDSITLVKYNASTGKIYIRGASAESTTLTKNDGNAINCVVSAGSYELRDMTIMQTNTQDTGGVVNCLFINEGASADVANCNFVFSESALNSGTNGIVRVNNGSITLRGNVSLQANGLGSGSRINMLMGSSGGTLTLASDLTMNGICQRTAWASSGGQIVRSPTALPVILGEVTGKRYEVGLSGIINTAGCGASYFPGTTAGTVDSSSYGIYK